MKNLFLACALTIVGLSAGSAQAWMTTVYPPSQSGELGHEAILEAIYGGDFLASGDDFLGVGALAGINAIRVDDGLDPRGILDVVLGFPGSAADQIWGYGDVTATAEARYAGFTQQFGVDRGNGVEVLFDVSGSGLAATGSATIDLSTDTWVWVRRDTDGTNPYFSEDARNDDDLDHMVTYQMEGLQTEETVWQVFWEDLPGEYGGRCDSDRDFNDLVVEIRAVPEPATIALMLAALPALIRRKRNRR